MSLFRCIFHLQKPLCVPWLMAPFFGLESHQLQVKPFSHHSTLTLFLFCPPFTLKGLCEFFRAIQKIYIIPPILRSMRDLNSTLPCKRIYSQFLRLKMWTPLGVVLFCLPQQMTLKIFVSLIYACSAADKPTNEHVRNNLNLKKM